MAKLTLSVDRDLIEGAKFQARRRGTSLSKLVSRFLRSLCEERGDEFFAHLHRELERAGFKPPPADDRELKRGHAVRKYL